MVPVTFLILILSLSLLIFSMLHVLPLFSLHVDFDSHCPLFLLASWRNDRTKNRSSNLKSYLEIYHWGNQAGCKFNKVIGLIGICFSISFMIFMSLKVFFKSEIDWLLSFFILTGASVLCVFLFTSLWVFSFGIKHLCNQLLQAPYSNITCRELQSIPFLRNNTVYRTDRFYDLMKTSLWGGWFSLSMWLSLCLICAFLLYRHSMREAFLVTFHRECSRIRSTIHPSTDYQPI